MGITTEQHQNLKVGDRLYCNNGNGWEGTLCEGEIYPIVELNTVTTWDGLPVIVLDNGERTVDLFIFTGDFSIVKIVKVPEHGLMWSEYMRGGFTPNKEYIAVQQSEHVWQIYDDEEIAVLIRLAGAPGPGCAHLEWQAGWEVVE